MGLKGTEFLNQNAHFLKAFKISINPLVYFECLDDLPFFMQEKILTVYQMATILNRQSLSLSIFCMKNQLHNQGRSFKHSSKQVD